jgi:hypothetical protein
MIRPEYRSVDVLHAERAFTYLYREGSRGIVRNVRRSQRCPRHLLGKGLVKH